VSYSQFEHMDQPIRYFDSRLEVEELAYWQSLTMRAVAPSSFDLYILSRT